MVSAATPVMLPPGRLKARDQASAHRIGHWSEHDWIVTVTAFRTVGTAGVSNVAGATAITALHEPCMSNVRIRRVGVFWGFPANDPVWRSRFEVFTESLKQLGWIGGPNIIFETRHPVAGDALKPSGMLPFLAAPAKAVGCAPSGGLTRAERVAARYASEYFRSAASVKARFSFLCSKLQTLSWSSTSRLQRRSASLSQSQDRAPCHPWRACWSCRHIGDDSGRSARSEKSE
jgi:hypothetical protein